MKQHTEVIKSERVHFQRCELYTSRQFALCIIIMTALCNMAGHYIFALWFLLLSSLFSSPNLSRRRLDVYRTLTHGVALVRI